MADIYTKQTWTAPAGTNLNKATIVNVGALNDGDGESSSITITPAPTLSNTPTPISVARLGHMEDGIKENNDDLVDTPVVLGASLVAVNSNAKENSLVKIDMVGEGITAFNYAYPDDCSVETNTSTDYYNYRAYYDNVNATYTNTMKAPASGVIDFTEYTLINGHKYFALVKVNSALSSPSIGTLTFIEDDEVTLEATLYGVKNSTTYWTITLGDGGDWGLALFSATASDFTGNGTTSQIVIDLTEVYGSGSEPTDPDVIMADLNLDYGDDLAHGSLVTESNVIISNGTDDIFFELGRGEEQTQYIQKLATDITQTTATDPTGTWTQITSSFGTSTIYDISYGNGVWTAVGTAGKLATATDPTGTWTQRTSSFDTSTIYDISYGNGIWTAVGTSGKLATATDPTGTWTQRTSSFGASYILDIAYGNGVWTAVGVGGKLATATDPTGTWTQRTSSFDTTTIYNISYGNGVWVAVGTSGKLATATEPTGTWTQRTSSFDTSNIWGISYGNGIWTAVGYGGKLATATDPTGTWTQRTSSFGTTYIYDIAYGNGVWVVPKQIGRAHV